MNFDQLRVFLSVAHHLHFSRAAEDLYISQPAVSASVAKLETRYGVKLFHRIGRRVELTDAGRFLGSEGLRLIDHVDRIERGLRDFHGLRRGAISLGASLTVGNYWLPSRLQRFRDMHDGIELRCGLANAEQVLEGTCEGHYDLCFVTGWNDRDDPTFATTIASPLSAEQVGCERLQLVVGRGHPWFGQRDLSPEELTTTRWAMREKGSGSQRLFEAAIRKLGLSPSQLAISLVLSSGEMQRAVVLSGGMAAALPESMVHGDMKLGLLWPVQIQGWDGGDQPIWMVRHARRQPTPLIEAFTTLIREGIENE
ncbi:MAG: LysR substrate-binding domain-containing protein, partial [Cyanobium sp.]